jgi:uncharacterized membrane protein required for colicin V production
LKELIDHIPILDVAIIGIVIALLTVGWKSGMPRMLMALGSIFTGFLLASIYYHLFAGALSKTFGWKDNFILDTISFLVVDLMVTSLMLGLFLGVFSHVEIKGRLVVFGRVFGAVEGVLVGLAIVGTVVILLRVPYEAHKQSLDATSDAPVIKLFNDGYDRSSLAPLFVKGAPTILSAVAPMLPPEARVKGTIPLLWGVTAEQ